MQLKYRVRMNPALRRRMKGRQSALRSLSELEETRSSWLDIAALSVRSFRSPSCSENTLSTKADSIPSAVARSKSLKRPAVAASLNTEAAVELWLGSVRRYSGLRSLLTSSKRIAAATAKTKKLNPSQYQHRDLQSNEPVR